MPNASSSQAIAAQPLEHSRIGGRYRIETVIAEGGMGSVYRVVDEQSGDALALKRMRGDQSRQMLALFEREYRTLAGISHPRIIRAFDYGVDAGGPYYTMELAPGRDLHQLAPMPFAEAFRCLRDVATCLALLHTRRLLHRDITPRNVRVLDSGACKLIDFGALMSFGIPEGIVGTPPCIPPEALRRQALDQRSDIFSFGALLYWTLTRKHAYPAKQIEDLPLVWRTRPEPPSSIVPTLPKQVDQLVMSLLHLDPLKRPATMADVVERLTLIAKLPPEDADTQRALADSYLAQADFVGREPELSVLRTQLTALERGRGSASLVLGPSGVGRSRFLRETIVQTQISGVRCVHVDAGMHRQSNGTAVAIVQQLLDTSESARREARNHAQGLAQLDADLAERLGVVAVAPDGGISGDWRARIQEILLAIVVAASSNERLLIAVDDIDETDDGSLAMLAGLLLLTEKSPLALVMSAPEGVEHKSARSWQLIRERCAAVPLSPLLPAETLVLARSLFGDVPNLARFAEWLHEQTSGLPLHCMELVRRLHGSGEIRYLDGLWVLPAERPKQAAAEGLSQLLVERLDDLSLPSLGLAQALAVQSGALSQTRCLEHAAFESDKPYALLDELVRTGVLEDSLQGYRFAHTVLREVLLSRTGLERRRELHLRCAQWELRSASTGDKAMYARVEAGWHFLQAGEERRGADELASVAFDTIGVRFAFADLQIAAPALEAALAVYTKQGRHLFERLPLMACLAQAGYYVDRVWGERYGEAALDAVQEVMGLKLARKLRPFLGKTMGLVVALGIAATRFTFTKKRVNTYRFVDVLIQMFGVVTTLTGAAAISLDYPNSKRIAATLEPFIHLPARITPVGIAQFCDALKEIARENEAHAIDVYRVLIDRFNDRRYYPTLPKQARPLYVGGLWFARGVFETFRDGGGGLAAADALDALGLKLYRMIASALRSLHYANRGQFEHARRHREQVDVHAIQIGSAWQVEMWEPAALILSHTACGDASELHRLHDRLVVLAARYPSLQLYADLSGLALALARAERSNVLDEADQVAERAVKLLEATEPRSFIGWAAMWGFTIRYYNMAGEHETARKHARAALAHVSEEDHQFVAVFLTLDIEAAVADAGLGDISAAKKRIDELMTMHAKSDNPLTLGRLHEGRARVAACEGDWKTFRHHLEEMRSWYRGTASPALIAQAERLRALDPTSSEPPPRGGPPTRSVARVRLPTPELPLDADPRTSRKP